MKQRAWMSAVGLALLVGGWASGGGPPCCESDQMSLLQRIAPAGGWNRYGGGFLHWWPKHCFPCNNGPDDYCRKPLPKVCWPPYPPYYIWGPPQSGPQCCHP